MVVVVEVDVEISKSGRRSRRCRRRTVIRVREFHKIMVK